VSNVTVFGRPPSGASDGAGTAEEVEAMAARPAVVLHPDLETVFRAEYAAVVSAARRVVGSPAAAEDVAQEVFLAFARSRVHADEAHGWLVVAAVHTALNEVRGERRRDAREQRAAPDQHDAVVPDVAEHATRQLDHARLRDALCRLPRQQATVLVLRHSGLSYAEIAAHTDLSPASVGTTLRRAEAALRLEMTDAPH
jgi:RNA polymerase sigma factor (sigma-70 family)